MPIARILKHVRNQRHFQLADIAVSTGISLGRLEEFEAGGREPTFRQFEALAKAYGIPSYLLETEALPNLPESPTDFRRKAPRPAHLSPNAMQKIWATEHVAQATKQLLDATKIQLATWIDDLPNGAPSAKTGGLFREFFNNWKVQRESNLRFTGTAEQIFFSCFRLFVEAQGTLFRVNQSPPEDFLGFYLEADEGVPSIFINRKISSPKAQLFTALHEYAHRIMGASGISDPFAIKNDTERLCNQFAVEFLAPQREFSKSVEGLSPTLRSDVFRFVDVASSQSLLSKHATAIRLYETGYITQSQLNAWLTARSRLSGKQIKNEDSDDTENNFGQVHAKLVGEVGYLATYVSGIALKEKLISHVDIATSISLSESIQERAIDLATRRMELAVA